MAKGVKGAPDNGLKGGGSKPGSFDRDVSVPPLPDKAADKGYGRGARIKESEYAEKKGQTS